MSFEPVFTGPDFGFSRYPVRQKQGRLHAFNDDRFNQLQFIAAGIEHQFIMNLQQHF